MHFSCYLNLSYHINFLLNDVLNYLQIVTQFLTMESLLDESVGREINFQIERGGTPLTVKLKVVCELDASYLICIRESSIYDVLLL
jgi:hypothetical protein